VSATKSSASFNSCSTVWLIAAPLTLRTAVSSSWLAVGSSIDLRLHGAQSPRLNCGKSTDSGTNWYA
jgi:hypothetical protein